MKKWKFKELATRGKFRWKNENSKNWQSEVSLDEKKWKFEELAVKGKSRYVNENWRTSRQGQVQTKKIKTYLIGHLDIKTNQVGTQGGGDDLKR